MLQTPQYFSHPSQFPDFTDHITNGFWTTDESFTQRRLSGICPIFMRKVLPKGNSFFISFCVLRIFYLFLPPTDVWARKCYDRKSVNWFSFASFVSLSYHWLKVMSNKSAVSSIVIVTRFTHLTFFSSDCAYF